MQKPLAVLNIEDSESDSDLIARLLKKAGYKLTFKRVETEAQMRTALKKRAWDLIISDLSLPQFDSYAALALLHEEGLDIPFVAVSGMVGEETAVAIMKAGAHDFLLKGNLGRLVSVVERELEYAKVRREHKQAQEALLESDSRFHQVWEITSDAMVLSDSEGVVLAVNPAYLDLYGYSAEQLIGHSFAVIFPQENRSWAVEQYKAVFASDVIPSVFEAEIRHADGTLRIVESRASFITKAGIHVAMLSTIRDITERKQAENELRISEKRFRALIENSLDDISLLAADGTLIWESPSIIRNLDYAPNEFMGRNMFELMHPDDLARNRNLFAQLIREPASQQPGSFRLKRSDGTWRWVEAIASNKLDEPGIQAIVINYRDVTERKQAEETARESQVRYQSLFEDSPIALWEEDFSAVKQQLNTLRDQGITNFQDYFNLHPHKVMEYAALIKILDVNNATMKLFGANSKNDLLKNIAELIKDEPIHQFQNELVCIAENQISFGWEGLVKKLDGNLRNIDLSWQAIPGHEESLSRVIVSMIDVTERKKAEEELRDSEKLFHELADNIEEVFWIHELSSDKDIYISPAYEKVWGRFLNTINDFFESVLPEDRAIVASALEKQMHGEQTAIEYRIKHLNGDIHWIWDRAFPIYDASDKLTNVAGIATDITKRKLTENALLASEASLQGILQSTADGILAVDLNNKVLFTSERFSEMWRIPQNIISSQDDEVLLQYVLEQMSNPQDFLEKIRRLYESQDESFDTFDFKDGRVFERYSKPIMNGENHTGRVWSFRDVTERVRSDGVLRESERKYRNLHNTMIDGFASVDMYGHILESNRSFQDITGYTAEELSKLTYRDLTPEKWHRVEQNIIDTQVLTRGFSDIFEKEYIGKDGKIFPVELHVFLIQTEEGKNEGMWAIVRDITQRKKTEEALLDNEARYRSLFDDSPVSLWEEDFSAVKLRLNALQAEGVKDFRAYFETHPQEVQECANLVKILDVNKATLKLFGAKSKDELTQSLVQFIANDPVELFRNELISIAQGKTQFEWEGINQTLDGRQIIVRLNLSALPGYEDSLSKVIISMIDITAHMQSEKVIRESEKSLRESQAIAGLGTYTLDIPSGKWISSDVLDRIFGIDESYIYSVENWVALVHPDWRQEMSDYFTNDVLENHVRFDKEYKIVRKNDGKERWVHGLGELEFNVQNEPVKMRGTIQDITERKQVQEKLQTAHQFLQSVQDALSAHIAILDSKGGIVQVNLAWRNFGFWNGLVHSNSGIGLNYLDVCDSASGPDAREAPLVAKAIREVLNGEMDEARVEYPCHAADKQRWFVVRITSFENNGEKWIVVSHENITIRKQVEDDLRQSEQRYRALFEDMPISIWDEDFSEAKRYLDSLKAQGVTDLRTYFEANPDALYNCAAMIKVVDVNQATQKMYHAVSKEELYKSMDAEVSESELEHIGDALIAIYEGKTSHSWEGFDETMTGEPIEISLTWSVAPGHEGDFSKVIVTTIDITERKQAEQALQTSEKRFRSLIANAGDLIIVIDSQGRIQFASPSSERILGYTPEKTIGINFTDWVHPDDHSEVLNSLARVVKEPGVTFESIQTRGRHKDGSWRILDSIGTNLLDEPAIQGIVLNIRDVTDRKLAEEALRSSEAQFRAIFEGAGIGIALVDTLGHPVKSNLALQDLLGYDSEELRSMLFTDFTHPDDVAMDWGLWQELIAGNRNEYQIEKRFIHKNGQIVWAKLTSSIVPDADGKLSFGVGMVEDITERKKAETEIEYQLAELEALYENGLAISRLMQPKQIAQRMVELIDQKLDWHHAAIRMYDAATDQIELLALNAPEADEEQLVEQINRINQTINTPDKGLSGWVIRHGEIVLIGNLKDDPRYIETYSGINSGLYVPIKSGEEIIGSIAVESEKKNAFTERDTHTLTTLANQAAISFMNARLYLRLQEELEERHRAEEEVRKLNIELEQRVEERTTQIEVTKRRLELAAEAGQIGVWEYNPRESKVIWDKRMHIIYQISEGEFNGSPQAWAQLIHPDDLAKSQINKQLAFTQNLLLNNEYRIILPNGSVRDISSSAITVASEDGTPERIIGINMDITESKQTEQSLRDSENYARLLFDAVADPVSVTEDNALIVDVNKAFEKQYNLVREDIRGKQISELGIYPEVELEKRETYLTAVIQGQPVKPIELEFYVPGDRIHTLELHSYPLKINDRRLMLNTAHDITAHKKAEETQRLAKSEMERALRIKNEFLANMSHELRTPLNSILGISESLEEQIAGSLNEKQLKYIGIVRESGRHLLDLINDILDLSKVEAGRMELDIHHVSVEKLCEASLRMIKEVAQKKSLNVLYQNSANIKIISGDERRLKQVLVNLLSNAVKFTPAGGRIGLQVSGLAETNEVEFTVWDQGIGIAQQGIQQLFKPFVQLDAGLSREYQGTGLGLALVAQMIHLHGGRVRVESEVGAGSRFIVTLPWALAEQTPKAKVTAELSLPVPRSDEKRSGRILVVEDTDVVIQLLGEYLRYKGYEVLLAHNGLEGIKLAEQERPDLILMDVMMPIMNGLEATQKLRTDETFKNTPIIALTALAMSGDSERCLAAGMNDYLSKPIQMQNLADMIEKYLGSAKEEFNEK